MDIIYIPDVQIWTSYVKVFEGYRLTDRQADRQTDKIEIIYHAASRVVKNINCRDAFGFIFLRITLHRSADNYFTQQQSLWQIACIKCYT